METMKKGDWSSLEHFSVSENWGDPYQMDRDLLYLLEYLRILFQKPFVIHCGYGASGHKPKTQHYVLIKKGEAGEKDEYIGKAADLHVKGMSFRMAVDLMFQILKTLTVGDVRRLFPEFMERRLISTLIANVIGWGIYPDWNNPGMHLDTRGRKARWGAVYRWVNGKRVQKYPGFEYAYNKIKE